MNPLALAVQILQAVLDQLKGQGADVIKQATEGAMLITSRIAKGAVELFDGDLQLDEAKALLNEQYDALKIVIETSLGTGELAAEQIPNDVIAAVKNVVFGTIGHLL